MTKEQEDQLLDEPKPAQSYAEVPCQCGTRVGVQWWGNRRSLRMYACPECALAAHMRGEIEIKDL